MASGKARKATQCITGEYCRGPLLFRSEMRCNGVALGDFGARQLRAPCTKNPQTEQCLIGFFSGLSSSERDHGPLFVIVG